MGNTSNYISCLKNGRFNTEENRVGPLTHWSPILEPNRQSVATPKLENDQDTKWDMYGKVQEKGEYTLLWVNIEGVSVGDQGRNLSGVRII